MHTIAEGNLPLASGDTLRRFPWLDRDAYEPPKGFRPRIETSRGCGRICPVCYQIDSATLTKDTLVDIPLEDNHPLLGDDDLQRWAARAAATCLAANWEDAAREGAALADLLGDVNEVAKYLGRWRKRLKAFL